MMPSQQPPRGNVRDWTRRNLGRHWRVLAVILALQLACALLMAAQPVFFQRIVSLVVSGAATFPLAQGLRLLLDLGLVYLAGTVFQSIGGALASAFAARFLKQLQVDFFERMIRLPIQTLHKQSAGEFFTKFSYDTSQAEMFLVVFLPSVTRELLTVLAVTAVLLAACPFALTAAALGIVAVTSATTVVLHCVMERFARTQRQQSGGINSLLDETLQGIDTLKTLASEDRHGRRFERLATELRDVSVKAGLTGAGFAAALDLVAKGGGILLVFLAYRLIARGAIDAEAFLFFFFYASMLQMSVGSLVNSLANFQPQLVGLRNVAQFLAEPVEDKRPTGDPAAIAGAVPIAIDGLTFGYPGQPPLYRQASLHAPAQAITLIHGPSGAGKSTLINLLHGFYTPHQGTIRFGAVAIDRLDRRELRRKVGVVTQDHFIFSDSIRENIRIANPEADDGRILDALDKVQLAGLVRRLPGGLDYRLDPRGKDLSAGERQRVCLARILLTDAPLMLLDEPWSNLDGDVRHLLAQVLNACRARKTIVIMSHEDIDTLIVDRVYRLEPETGRIVPESERCLGTAARRAPLAGDEA